MPEDRLNDYSDFVNAEPVAPRKETDTAVYRLVRGKRGRMAWPFSARFLSIQIVSGSMTLALCPQFGIGPGSHNPLLHALHAFDHPLPYYLSCGMFFVLLGALLSALAADGGDLKVAGRALYPLFALYSVGAYALLVAFGSEAFLFASLFWILGAVLGNVIGFAAGMRLRRALA